MAAVLVVSGVVLVTGTAPEPDQTAQQVRPARGGTLHLLTVRGRLQHLDPQRDYVPEDIAFSSAYLTRTLTTYPVSPDARTATGVVPDLATDTGRPSDHARTWRFTLRPDVKFQDGSAITCADVRYGVSRSFATGTVTDGPVYALTMLDIPTRGNGAPVYRGPYAGKHRHQAAFDKAVQCSKDDRTITFHLSRPVGDFNQTVTLPAFSPVPRSADTGARYDLDPVSSGPYRVHDYQPGDRLVLVRNPAWHRSTDSVRHAYPDSVVVHFGTDPRDIAARLTSDDGDDQRALTMDPLDPVDARAITRRRAMSSRRVDAPDTVVTYLAVNTSRLTRLDQRRAVAVALDRRRVLDVSSGGGHDRLADAMVEPSLMRDHTSTGVWSGLLGGAVPPDGDPALARRLLRSSGKPLRSVVLDYPRTPTNGRVAQVVVASLARAGIRVERHPVAQADFYRMVLDPGREGDLCLVGWSADWPDASTVLPEMFTPSGSFDLSRVHDGAYAARAANAQATTDRSSAARQWRHLDRDAVRQVWAVPLGFRHSTRLGGSKVGAASGPGRRVYVWAPYGAWPYTDLYVVP
jgi:peptide/nickel transport system substrate-binding protein